MSTLASLVAHALNVAGIPVVSVTIGDPQNRATWTVQYGPGITAGQQTTAAALLLSVAIDPAAQAAQDDLDAQLGVDQVPLVLKAVVLALIDQLNVIRAGLPSPLGPITPAQALAAIRAKAGTL